MRQGQQHNYRPLPGAFLLAVLLLLLASGAGADDGRPPALLQGWSLLPESTQKSKARPSYTLSPHNLNLGRVQTSKTSRAAPLLLLKDEPQPLFFELNNQFNQTGSDLQNHGQLDLTGTLGWQPMDQLVVALGLHKSIFENPQPGNDFQTISNIHCESASLEAGMYHASNCYFTELGYDNLISDFSSLGASWGASENTSIQLEYFRQNTAGTKNLANLLTDSYNPLTDNRAMLPTGLLGGSARLDGFGINMALGFNHDQMGKLKLGLQISRINNINLRNTLGQISPGLAGISPFHTASVNIDWHRGSFSGGIQGYYRQPITLHNQQEVNQAAGFDIYFSWHAPWNGNLSIGTTSVLEPGLGNKAANDNSSDPFETIYGQVPYVRYQQDL